MDDIAGDVTVIGGGCSKMKWFGDVVCQMFVRISIIETGVLLVPQYIFYTYIYLNQF